MPSARTSVYARTYAEVLHHKKFVALDPAAIGLWTMGNAYCWAQFTDGVIPKAQVPRLIAVKTAARAYALADALVTARLWEDAGDTYQVHDWLEHNPPAEKVLTKRVEHREDMRKRRRGKSRDTPRESARDAPRDEHVRDREVEVTGIYPPIGSHSQTGTDRPLPPIGGLCAERDRQAGRAAGECAMSRNCPRHKACAAWKASPA